MALKSRGILYTVFEIKLKFSALHLEIKLNYILTYACISMFQLGPPLTVLTATPGMTPGAMTPGTGLILR